MVHFGDKVLDKRVHENKTIHIKIDTLHVNCYKKPISIRHDCVKNHRQ